MDEEEDEITPLGNIKKEREMFGHDINLKSDVGFYVCIVKVDPVIPFYKAL